jgi:transcriptional regulator with XRE-family HTH domain
MQPHEHFKQARERVGLSVDEAAHRMGMPWNAVWDIETDPSELTMSFSPAQVQGFCNVLGIRPARLFGVETREPPISVNELVQRIHDHCRSHGLTLAQFEDVVGWRLDGYVDPPERLFETMTIDGLQWLCEGLGVDWHRVILGLD